jgi:hypothetical protein
MIMKIAEVKRDLPKGKSKVGVDLHRLPQKVIKLEVGQEANVQKAAQCLRPRSPSKAAAARREEERQKTKQHVLARPRTSAKAAAARKGNRCRRAKQLLPSLKLRGRVKGVRNVAGKANLRIPQEPRPLQMIPRTAHPPLQKTREWIS